ncbi:hypothetical protein [Dactylosporangium matsuzakiense]|uniref:Uncharacterized protein n=1 Tax=Dactylosporangium matsuzakiense TaxID=53360 RepID=A0A9W6KVC3_9ACTN|nr:hypothetical protein [Dactylosporangium matsuzakiense]GLL08762.1 hypothetical protein GCM10017581_105340 [Dactylosporangium matsuzakiense]
MVTGRLAALLLALAARRWPADLREEMCREWVAEVHLLAGQRRRWQMLRFTLSLAATRPAVRPFSPAAAAARAWPIIRLVLVLPLATTAVALLSVISPAAVGGAVLMTLVGRRYTVRHLPSLALVPALTIPGCALCGALYRLDGSDQYGRHTPAALLFFAGLAGTLAVAARLASRGRIGWAWMVGVVGVILFADAAVPVVMYGTIPSADTPWHWGYSPMWLLNSLTGSSLGLPYPSSEEIFTIQDEVPIDPTMYLTFGGFALGTMTGTRRPGPDSRGRPMALAAQVS